MKKFSFVLYDWSQNLVMHYTVRSCATGGGQHVGDFCCFSVQLFVVYNYPKYCCIISNGNVLFFGGGAFQQIDQTAY